MFDVLRRNPGFRRLWAAQVVSQLGDWIGRVAIVTRIAELSGVDGATTLGILFALDISLRMLPGVVLGPLAGPLADRLPRRALMFGADIGRAACVFGLVFVDTPSELPLLYALLIAQMSLSTFFESAKSAAIPSTLAKGDLQSGYALSAATWSTMLAVGSFLGGELMGPLGIERVLLLDAGTYLLSAVCLYGLVLPPVPIHPQRFSWRDVLSLTELRRAHRHARGLHLLPAVYAKIFWGGAGGFLVILNLAATARYGLDEHGELDEARIASATGLLFLARGIGTGLGPVVSRYLFPSTSRSLRRQIGAGFLVALLGYLPFPLAPNFELAFACVVFAHLGGSAIWVSSTVLWQRGAHDAFRGRLSALERSTFTLALTVGAFIAGFVFDASNSLQFTTWTNCAFVVVGGALWAWWSSVSPHGKEVPNQV